MNITFYYARKPSEMLHLQEQCTIWLPEQQLEEPAELWQPNQIIATCDLSYLFRLRDQIQAGNIQADKAIWIEVKNQTATAYTFDNDGKISNFFRVV